MKKLGFSTIAASLLGLCLLGSAESTAYAQQRDAAAQDQADEGFDLGWLGLAGLVGLLGLMRRDRETHGHATTAGRAA